MQILAKKPGDEPVNMGEEEPADYEGWVVKINTTDYFT